MRDMNHPNMKDAFKPMPDQCRSALMEAACSVKEEEPMKRTPFRVALIAAAVLVATMALAFAASQLGLSDWFKSSYGINLPDSAKTALSVTEQKTYTLGPLSISLLETLADGRLVYVTTKAVTADGSKAVISMDPPYEKPPEGMPVYLVSSYITFDRAYIHGEEMMDCFQGEDGSALSVDMLLTDPSVMPETLSATLHLKVSRLDPETNAFLGSWQQTDNIAIPVTGVLEERTYTPQGDAAIAGFTVKQVLAQRTCAGVYLTTSLTAEEETDRKEAQLLYKHVVFADEEGQTLPMGINLTGQTEDKQWPAVTMEEMVSLDRLPDTFQLLDTDENKAVVLK